MGKIKLGKPPIVERWLSFDFEPNPSKTVWDGKLANELADSLSLEFPGRVHIWAQQIRVTHAGPGTPVQPEFLVRLDCVRCANASSTELFQIRDDQIAYNRLRGRESIRSGLITNHDFMINCFEHAFSTTKCWDLFEPYGA